jgi:hypothetical protein
MKDRTPYRTVLQRKVMGKKRKYMTSFIKNLLQIQQGNFNQTWHKSFLGEGNFNKSKIKYVLKRGDNHKNANNNVKLSLRTTWPGEIKFTAQLSDIVQIHFR